MRQPTKFGKYVLLERIAVGGMAEVFVAKAFGVEGFERLLAIKKILPTMGEDAEFISMFVDEARIAVQLSHANIVQVLELGKHEEHLYIAMEYISGRDLRQLIERFRKRHQPMPIPQVCRIVAEVCEALDYAHRRRDSAGRPLGIVHRDVSPQNVLVSYDGEVKLIDFGIAKAESRLQRTQAGILKGKFSYMSPEQVKGQNVDGRSDIFATGVVLWELVCGEKLFTGDSDFAVLEKVRSGAVPSPRSIAPQCPEGLERVIFKALANDPAQRYQTASELHDDLMRFTLAGDNVYGSRQLAEWLRKEFSVEWEKEQARQRGWVAVERVEVTPAKPLIRPELPVAVSARESLPWTAPSAIIEAGQGEAVPQWRLEPDADTLVMPPTPPRGSTPVQAAPLVESYDLPTMKLDGDAVVKAEQEFAERAAAEKKASLFEAEETIDADPGKATVQSGAIVQKARPPPPPADASGRWTALDNVPNRADDVAPRPFDLFDEHTAAPRAMRGTPLVKPLNSQKKLAGQNRKLLLYVFVPVSLAVLAGLWFILTPPERTRRGKFVITPSPSVTADLRIDGKPAGQLPPFVHTVPAGRHRIELRAEGYKPFVAEVQVPSGGRPIELDAQLVLDGPMQVEGMVLTQPRPVPPADEKRAR
jgi:serine/threonine protein kinase